MSSGPPPKFYDSRDILADAECCPPVRRGRWWLTHQTRMPSGRLGAALLEARLRSGRSQAEVARKVGISKASVSNYARGRYNPRLSIAALIAESLGVDRVSTAARATGSRCGVCREKEKFSSYRC